MSQTVDRGMVLAAGLGTRMAPITHTRPKAMVEVAGRMLVDWALDRFVAAGVDEVVVNVHHFADLLESHLAKRDAPRIVISDERPELLETGGGIVKAIDFFDGEPFFVQNCDAMWLDGYVPALERLRRAFDPERMDALLLLAPTVLTTGYAGRGDFGMDPFGVLTRRPENGVVPFVFTGVQIVHPRMFESAPLGRFSVNKLFDRAIEAGRLFGLRHDGFWMHVGTPDAIAEAELIMRRA